MSCLIGDGRIISKFKLIADRELFMSTVIYFSGTGNSYHIAKQIAEHQNAQLISITDFDGKSINDDRVGFVFPIYCGELPRIVVEFLDRVVVRAKYIWAIATSGGTVGTAFSSLDKSLRYNEMRLSFAEMMLMPDNSIIMSPRPGDVKSALENEPILVQEVIRLIDEECQNEYVVESFSGKTSKIQWASLKSVIRINNKKINHKTCSDCGICIEICPMNNIVRVGEKIKIGPNCTNCFACLHWCPTHSIKAGFLKVTSASRYTHPSVMAKELFRKN
jgi:ferredoxin